MRRLLSLLLAFPLLCVTHTLSAQSDYYWCNGEKIFLSTDKSTLSVFFEEPQMLDGLSSRNVSTLLAERKNDHSPVRWAVLNTGILAAEGQTSSPGMALRAIGLDQSGIKSAEFGRITHNQDLVWLTHNILYRPNPSYSQAAFDVILGDFPTATLSRTGGGLYVVSVAELDQVLPLANKMYESGMFHYAEPSFRQRGAANSVQGVQQIEGCNPTDSLLDDQMVLDNDGPNTSGTYNYPFWAANKFGTDINASDAWCISTGNSSTIVAVFDEGVEAHKDLETAGGASRVLPGYNTDPTYSTSGGPVGDFDVHGMGVAGIMAASHNDEGIAGIAPEVQILPVHAIQVVFDDMQRADGIMWAYKNGADILVNAWTYNSCSYYSSAVVEAIDSALTYGRGGLGTFVVFSSGHIYPGQTSCVKFPANVTQAFTVGAMGTDQGQPDYAPHGAELDAVGISSVDSSHAFVATLDRMVLGNNYLGTPAAYLDYPDTAYTRYFGGTSTTAAEAGGIAALILDVDASLTATEIANIITGSTRDFGLTLDPMDYGAGVMDAHAAVLAAQSPVFPVAWNYLDGEVNGDRIQLSWGTLSETNADRFEVERLEGDDEFVKLGEVAAAGTSTFPNDYQFFDLNPAVGENIYRLKQLDVDGNFTYSDNVEVEFGDKTLISEPYPNPVSGTLVSVDVVSPASQSISCTLLDLTGRVLSVQQVDVNADSETTLIVSVEDLAAGVYLLRITDDSGISLSTSQLIVK